MKIENLAKFISK